MFRRLSPSSAGRWSARHPWRALAAWLGFVVVALLALALSGSRQLQNGAVGESARGYALMNSHRLGFAPREYAYLHSDTSTADGAAFRGAIGDVARAMRTAFGASVSVGVSTNRRAALVAADAAAPFSQPALERAVAAAHAAHPQVSTTLADVGNGAGNDLHRAETLSVPVTLLVLLIAFGALVAALVPVLLAVTAVVAAFGLLGPLSHLFPLDDSVKTVVLLIGMAVGVDYALFYVVRSREERRHGRSTHDALERTARTSGRAIVVAGTTVVIAMAAQFAVGSSVFDGIAIGTIAVVACAVAGSVTVLPALLELLGPRIDRGRIPFLPRLRSDGDSRFWNALIDRVLRHPLIAATLSAALLLALAVPALGLHVAKPSADALSSAGQSTLARQITSEFPGISSPRSSSRHGRSTARRRSTPPPRASRRSPPRAGSRTRRSRWTPARAPGRWRCRSPASAITPRVGTPCSRCAASSCRRRSDGSRESRPPSPAMPRRMSTSRAR